MSIIENWSVTSSSQPRLPLGVTWRRAFFVLDVKLEDWTQEKRGDWKWSDRRMKSWRQSASLQSELSWKFWVMVKKHSPSDSSQVSGVSVAKFQTYPTCSKVAQQMWPRSPDSTPNGCVCPCSDPPSKDKQSYLSHLSVTKPKGPLYYDVTLPHPQNFMFFPAATFLLV